MAPWTRICCAIDFSEQSRMAMRKAARIAERDGANLTLLHVGETPVIGAATEGAPSTIEEVEMQLRRDLEPLMAAAKEEAEAERRGGSVETVVTFGKAPDEIVRLAVARGFDLLVVGTHGWTGFRRFVFGSVAERVVREAPCSVLVFRHASSFRARDLEHITRREPRCCLRRYAAGRGVGRPEVDVRAVRYSTPSGAPEGSIPGCWATPGAERAPPPLALRREDEGAMAERPMSPYSCEEVHEPDARATDRLISAFLRERRDELIREWEALAYAAAKEGEPSGAVLRDHVAALLDAFADWVERGDQRGEAPRFGRIAAEHVQRLDQALQVAQLLRECRALHHVLLHGLLRAAARSPASAAPRLIAAFDEAIWDALEHFAAERDAELARSEEARRAAAQRYGELVQLSPDGIVVHRDCRIAFANRAAVALFGASSAHDLVGRSPFDLVHPDDRARVQGRVGSLLAGEVDATPPLEMRLVRLDGAERTVEANAAAFDDADGKAIEFVLRDVTARRRAQEELQAADQRKTEFLAVLSHELRNDLAPLVHALRLIERTPPGSPQSARAREILARQVGHLTSLVDDLLDISRINVGKIKLDRTRFDAREALRRVCDDARPAFEERGVSLHVDVGAVPLWVDADQNRLTQIAGNLLGNALKFTVAPGAVHVTVAERAGRLQLRVRDEGIGIEPRLLAEVFEPFVQADAAGALRGGMGLGLALVKNLAVLHGGTVCAESEGIGRGAEFVVALPLAGPPVAPVPEPSRTPLRSLDILIVEHHRDTAETLRLLLGLEGHRTRVALDGCSAVAAFRERAADVLISDVGLPDVSGYELVRTLRLLEAGVRRVFAIAFTGRAQAEDVQRAAAAGFDAHLPKPAPMERLQELLAVAASAAPQ